MGGQSIPAQGNWKRYRAIHSFKYYPALRNVGAKNGRNRKNRTEILGRSIPQQE